MNVEMFFSGFWMYDLVHHRGSEIALRVKMKPCEKRDYLVKHGKDDTECKRGEQDV